MKKILFVLFVFVCVSSFCSVQVVSAVVPAPISEQDMGTRFVTGKIESVSSECSAAGTMATIIIVDKNGKKVNIEVKLDTVIYDKDDKAISFDKIQKGNEVTIEYMETKETIESAESIKLKK